ncbi:MAG: hypothetical protein D6724_00800 [Armatimonadetes bacterium]|nr:MAG: hypothetical protein D6724_00800 [Armatimonadota bacterium]GIV01769.1 MAG: hypothetical protein KatS3mg015_0599 [Fimbriimonadales bacterium]
MPKLIGLLCALVALAACVLSGVEPLTSVLRAVLAFVVGMVGTQIWYVFFATRIEYSKEEERGQGS